jgi:hypothetical protein
MHNGPKRMRTRPPRSAASFAARSKPPKSSAVRSEPKHSQNAQRNYEQYLALARAEVLIGMSFSRNEESGAGMISESLQVVGHFPIPLGP